MVFKKFRIQIVVRVLLMVITIFVLMRLFYLPGHRVTAFVIVLVLAFQTYSLCRFVEQTNRKLSQFLSGIRHADFSTSFSDRGLGRSFEGLNLVFNDVISAFKKNRAEKEEHFNYLQTVVQHVSIGILAFQKDGRVDMFNNSVKRLLHINNLKHIEELALIKSSLPEHLLKMRSGDNQLVKLFINDELMQISVRATEFRMRGEEFILVTMQDIHAELEEKEIESWQKLIRVLTHEIMNSITPISSLAVTVRDMLIDQEADVASFKTLDLEDVESISSALNTIAGRSQGLLNFVEIYRNLTRIPKPNFRYFPVKDLYERAFRLLEPKLEKYNIQCQCRVIPENLMVTADPDLVDQVFINLMLNAIDVVKGVDIPRIQVTSTQSANGRIVIEFRDNGYGIKPDIMDKIFMPFFTSKKNGSGIGLSLSRQIMHLHKGNISVSSKPGEGTAFTLSF